MAKKTIVKHNNRDIELHIRELALILAMRKCGFGEMTIKIRDGLPSRAIEIKKFDNLDLELTVDR